MTTPLDDHTLNACLARAIEKDVVWNDYDDDEEYWQLWDDKQGILGQAWSPLQNASQMEEVEAWLRENGYNFGSAWDKLDGHWTAHIELNPNPAGDPKILYRTGYALDKKRAFALAIWQMEQHGK